MKLVKQRQYKRAEHFRHLHHSDKLLVLPNAWDAGSAVIFEKAGFQAIGTSSAGIAYSLGYPDGEQISFADILECSKPILKRISIPLSVDIEAGYDSTLGGIVTNAKHVIELGAVGINLEDGVLGSKQHLTDLDVQTERIKAIASLKKELGIPFVINARTDVYWLSIGKEKDRLKLAIERAQAYAEAGADCIFVPASFDRESIQTLVREVPAPVNLIAALNGLSLEELESFGIARLSLGSSPVRASLGLTQGIAAELKQGSFESMMRNAMPYQAANELFS